MAKKTKTLEPIHYKDAWHKPLADLIFAAMKEAIFDPLVKDTNEILKNAKDSLLEKAIRDGDIWFKDGMFHGSLSAGISKEIKALGGSFRRGKWHLDESALPQAIRAAVQARASELNALAVTLASKFNDMTKNVMKIVSLADLQAYANQPISRVSKEFKRTVGKMIAVSPEIDDEGKEKIKERYLRTDELPIRENTVADYMAGIADAVTNFSQDTVDKLRSGLFDLIKNGAPRKEISKYVQSRLRVSKDRSDFIARQETALLTVEIKRQQYERYGINKYKWVTMGDHKVRKRHIELNGKTIDWSEPPIVDEKTGRRAHAGQDFRCRCVDKPIVSW